MLVQRVVKRQRNIIIMNDNYTGNGSNNANGFQIDIYIFFGHMKCIQQFTFKTQ
jgi:hypothetical protein